MNESTEKQAWLTLAAAIDQTAARAVFTALSGAVMQNLRNVHLLIQSEGGYVNDGVAIANFMRGLPLDITTYNVGQVSSAAVLPYLAGRRRVVARNAIFLFHRSRCQPLHNATSALLSEAKAARELDDQRMDILFQDPEIGLQLTPEFLTRLDSGDVFLDADDAVKLGVAHEIGNFKPRLGDHIQNLQLL